MIRHNNLYHRSEKVLYQMSVFSLHKEPFFYQTDVLIFGQYTRSACTTLNFWDVNMRSLCNRAIFWVSTVCCAFNLIIYSIFVLIF